MNRNMVIFLALTSLCALIGCFPATTPPSSKLPLGLTITPDKEVYRVGEVVTVTLRLRNNGKERLLVYGRMDFVTFDAPIEFSLGMIIVRDLQGNSIPYKRFANIAWQPVKEDFIYLEPGDSVMKSEYIEDSDKYTEIGMYTMIAIYQNSFDPGDVFENTGDTRMAWKGTITSESVSFEVKP